MMSCFNGILIAWTFEFLPRKEPKSEFASRGMICNGSCNTYTK